MLSLPLAFAALAASAAPAPADGIVIDGRIDPHEWQGARHVTDFRQVQPLTRKPGTLPTEAWIKATPEGLAVAFRCTQPPGVRRTHRREQRDFDDQVDRINVMVDFDGDGATGFDFTVSSTDGIFDAVITSENRFSKDWDGRWKHAVSEDTQGWSAEVLIPWYTAPMHSVDGDTRTIGLYLDRVVGSTGERMAWPTASYERSRFLSDFNQVEVASYSQSLLAVTPYVSGVYDNVRGDSNLKKGVDVFWKPNGQFQLTATLNPDFGQVESDDLVVNFGATETYFSDKRPFFTENQGIFDFSLLDDNSALVYTRRVGAASDNGNGPADITGAVKLNGSVGDTSYGVLTADERGEAGRDFGALRVTHDFGTQTLGMLLTRVNRPFLDRQATVLGVDHHWQPNAEWTVWSNVVGSDIRTGEGLQRGSGATFLATREMAHGWRQQWLAMHFGNHLQINDFGYLPRNSMNYAHYEVQKRLTGMDKTSRYSSHVWRFRVDGVDNDHGVTLRRQLRISRDSQLRNGGKQYAQININSAGHDDLITRGHGDLRTPPSFNAHFDHSTPRHGRWAFAWQAEAFSGGLAGNRKIGFDAQFKPTFYVSDAFSLYAGVYAESTPDWLVWQHDNLIGSFNERSLQLDSGFDWSIGQRQELRFKLQALSLNAPLNQAYRVRADGGVDVVNDPVSDFSVRNLGLQIRYRYELAPLSWLYIVYGRGGYDLTDQARDVGSLFGRSFSLRNDEQLLVKLNYRFEL